MPRYAKVALRTLVRTCEEIYDRDGYVRWAEVAEVHGISRQAVQARLKSAIERGELSAECHDRWQSMASRAQHSRGCRDQQELNRMRRLDIQLSPANYEWLEEQCAAYGAGRAEVMNSLLNQLRRPCDGDPSATIA